MVESLPEAIVPRTEEILADIEEIVRFGSASPATRATPAPPSGAEERFQSLGLEDVYLEPVSCRCGSHPGPASLVASG